MVFTFFLRIQDCGGITQIRTTDTYNSNLSFPYFVETW